MKKTAVTLLALLATAALVYFFPRREAPGRQNQQPVIRIWITEPETAAARWARACAAAYEKTSGRRLYLRSATAKETEQALENAQDPSAPDAVIGPEGNRTVALRGYALILRDDKAGVVTPEPTSALFYRPSPVPGPTAAPPALPPWNQIGAVLAPPALAGAVPGAIASADPAGDFSSGKARAALLTAGQAAQLTVGFRAFPVPQGKGLLPVRGRALTADGQEFLRFLLQDARQEALRDYGLFALDRPLYTFQDPVRHLIDGSREAGGVPGENAPE